MKVQLPWCGKATGSSAGLIYQSYWGKTYARTFPAIFHYPDTPAQQACQRKYWHSRIEAENCYKVIQGNISSYQKRIANTYNAMQKSVIDMFAPLYDDFLAPLPKSFGIDSIKAINASFKNLKSIVLPEIIILNAELSSLDSKFIFRPNKCFLAVINSNQREIWTVAAGFKDGIATGNWKNTTSWPTTDTAYFYVALADDHYISNFINLDEE